jgi:hypothetical protein
VRELIDLDGLALMQSLCHSSAGNCASRHGLCLCGAELSSSRPTSRGAVSHTASPPAIAPADEGLFTRNHRGARGRHELQDHRAVRAHPLPPPRDRRHSATTAPLTARRRLYRRSLKLALDWAVHRYLWRGQAMYIRSLFEANKAVTEPRQQRVRCVCHWSRRSIADTPAGLDQGDGEPAAEVEASGPVPPAHGAWR